MPDALGTPVLRALHVDDRAQVESILTAAGNFHAGEATVALELFDLGVAVGDNDPVDPDYRWIGAEVGSRLAGVACYGPTPATEGTFDLYWLAVAESHQGIGIGAALLKQVEDEVTRVGGRLLVIETSSVSSYDRSRAFYQGKGYNVLATVRDFYAPGDSRLILGRRQK